MRVAKRICAFALALTIAFLSIGYEPPKANAVVTEVVGTSALATSALASYMTATGVPLTVISGGAAAASAGTASLISGYAAATGATYEVVTTAIAAGATISGGTIILGAAAVAVLAGVVAWAVKAHGLVDESNAVINDTAFVFGNDRAVLLADGSLFYLSSFDRSGHKLGTAVTYGSTVEFATGWTLTLYPKDGFLYIRVVNSSGNVTAETALKSTRPYDNLVYYGYSGDGSNGNTMIGYRTSETGIDWGGISEKWTTIFGNYSDSNCSISIDANYEPLPELAPEKQLRIETGVNPELAPEAVPDAIFESIAGNEFTPTYVEEPVADPDPDPDTGGSDNPDDGTENEPSTGVDLSGVLGWLEAIWNAIKSLVEAIGDKLMQLFVPSEEYMEALPEALTDAFAERTGFLTYPMSLLFGFVDLIATPAGDFILEWDDVYEPFSHGKLISAGQFNVTQYVNSNQALSNVYSLWKTVVSGYLIFMFFDLCYKKYNAIVRDRLG